MVLEEDDFDPFSDDDESEEASTKEYSPVLRYSIIVVAASLLVILLTAIAANNSPPNSSVERTTLGINQGARVVLLLGFFGVLIGYRMPQIKELFASSSNQRDYAHMLSHNSQMALEDDGVYTAKLAENGGQPATISKRRPPKQKPTIFTLMIITAVGLGLIWAMLVAASFLASVLVGQLLEACQLLLIGLMAVLVFYARGPLRGYAISSLAVLLCCQMDGAGLIQSAIYGMYSYGDPSQLARAVMINSAIVYTTAGVAGLLGATIVLWIEKSREGES